MLKLLYKVGEELPTKQKEPEMNLTENMKKNLVNLIALGSARASFSKELNAQGLTVPQLAALKRRGLVDLESGNEGHHKFWAPTDKGRKVAETF
jgi:hypothetical protein